MGKQNYRNIKTLEEMGQTDQGISTIKPGQMEEYTCPECGAHSINEDCEECGYVPPDEYASYE